MFDRDSLRGIIPPLATPLTTTGEIDRAGMGRLVDHVLGAGVHGVFVLGSTGEFPFLTARQRVQVVEAAAQAVGGRVPVIAGISAVGTREAIAHAKAAAKAGADFLMITPPYFGTMAMAQDWIERHIVAVADEAAAPVLLYNVPPLIGDIEPATVERLATHDRILGMKDSAQLIHLQDILFRTRERGFRVLSGLPHHIVAALLVGAHGSTPSPANLVPRAYVDLFEATIAGDLPRAFALQEHVNRFSDRLYAMPSYSSVIKGGLSLMGICGPTVAAPLPALTTEETELVQGHLAEYGLLG